MKSGFTRTGKRTTGGALDDGGSRRDGIEERRVRGFEYERHLPGSEEGCSPEAFARCCLAATILHLNKPSWPRSCVTGRVHTLASWWYCRPQLHSVL